MVLHTFNTAVTLCPVGITVPKCQIVFLRHASLITTLCINSLIGRRLLVATTHHNVIQADSYRVIGCFI